MLTYRFYTLYDKIGREDILAHAYAQSRLNKGAQGLDGQDFADIEAYGVERWLGELALALREETYRPDPIRRVFIPKANGKAVGHFDRARSGLHDSSDAERASSHQPGMVIMMQGE
jgi:retron-type reverse transcriptase